MRFVVNGNDYPELRCQPLVELESTEGLSSQDLHRIGAVFRQKTFSCASVARRGRLAALLHTLLLLIEAAAFAVGSVAVLTVIGLAIADWALPSNSMPLLLAPAVGLAALALGFQWLTFLVPADVAAVVVIMVSIPPAAWTLWKRRGALLTSRSDLVAAAVVVLALFLALIQIDVQRGFFTLGGWPSDNIFIYAQAAQYVVDHPMPSALHPAAFANPGSDYFMRTGPAFPNSVGPIDAAVSVLTGRPVYAVFDSINAIALAMTVGPVWVFIRLALRASWLGAAAASLILATNQLLYWVVGIGFQQESMAMPILTTGLVTAALVLRAPTLRGGLLLGGLVAALAGVYLPIAALLVLCAVACAAVAPVTGDVPGPRSLLAPIGGAMIAGVLAGAAALYVLLVRGGFSTWALDTSVRVPAGGVSMFPFLPYVLGALPFAHGWEAGRLPFGTLDRLALPMYAAGSALILVLLVIGVVRAARSGRGPEAALLVAAMLFAGYEAAIAQYPYGFVKSIGYTAPMTSVFIAYGALGELGISRELVRRRANAAGVVSLAIIVIASGLASRDMVKLWLTAPGLPTLPSNYLAFSEFAAFVPAGRSVLILYPSDDYGSLVKAAALAYFLPDRDVRVYVGTLRIGTFPDQDVLPPACSYDYVISRTVPGSDFTLIYTDTAAGLAAYRRDGPACLQ